jgi:hypothetical protein
MAKAVCRCVLLKSEGSMIPVASGAVPEVEYVWTPCVRVRCCELAPTADAVRAARHRAAPATAR